MYPRAGRPFKVGVVLVAFAASCAAAEDADALPEAPVGKVWRLTWHDEFDGPRLDATKWNVAPEKPRKGGWWSPRAVELDGEGHLVIRTFRDGDRIMDGCVTTERKFEHAQGFYMARARLQSQPGHWPAFWIIGRGVQSVGDGGRDGCEIDIMEKPWLDDRVQHTLHWDGFGEQHATAGKVARVPGVMEGFHTFALWWRDDGYVFYVDGRETWRTDAGGACQVPQYLMLSDEVGKWAGDIENAQLPDEFVVDFVRVYDLVDEP